MADITQRLGFDVSQGVSALNSLRGATRNLTQSLQALNKVSLSNVSKRISGLSGALGTVPKKAQAARIALDQLNRPIPGGGGPADQLNKGLDAVGNKVEETGSKIRQTLAVAFVTQKALSGLRQIRDLLLDAAEASREFGLAIAEVSTVAGSGDSIRGLSNAVRDLSVQFGRPEVEQAEAAYQAFSNQVVQSEAELRSFGSTANTLAIGAVSSVADSVNVLSSVMNSYGDEAGTATEISDVLFKTVEEGRLRLGEIANTLGTVTPLAKEAGVSFEEVTAALATITKRGTTASVAMTQVRGIISKLLKPTELMNAAFRSFGATDGPSAIKAAGGLSNLLQKMRQFAEENGTTLNQMFGRVRAGAGALNLTAESGEEFNRILGELEGSAGAAQAAFDKINGTDARQAEIEFNKLRVTMSKLGDEIVPIITKFVRLFNEAVPDAQTMSVAILGVSAALAVLAAGGVAALATLIPLGPALLALAPAIAIAAGIAAATAIYVQVLQQQNAEIQKQIDLQSVVSEASAQSTAAILKSEQDKLAAIEKSASETRALIQDVFADAFKAAADSNARITQVFQGAVAAFVDTRKQVLKEIQSAISGADAEIAASANRLKSVQQEIADIKFDRGLEGLTQQQQVAATLSRALKTAAQSRRELANAGLDQDKAKEALDNRALARQQLADAERAAAATATKIDDKQVADAKLRFLRQIEADEKKRSQVVQDLKEKEAGKAKEVEEAIKRTVAEVENLTQRAIEAVDTLQDLSTGPAEAAIAAKELEETLKRINQIGQTNETQGLDRQVGAGGQIEAGNQALLDATAKFAFDRATVQREFEQQVGPVTLDVIANLQEITENQTIQVDAALAADTAAKLQAQLDRASAQFQAQVTVGPEAGITAEGLATVFSSLTGQIAGAEAAVTKFLQAATQGVPAFDQAQIAAGEAKIREAQAFLDNAIAKEKVTASESIALQAQIDAANSLLQTKSQQIEAEAQAAKAASTASESAIDETARAAERLGASASSAATGVGSIGPAAQTASTQGASSANSLIGRLKATEQQANRTAQAVAAALSGGGTAGTAFFGKRIHRQTGGFTRGQDRVLTSTAPGEFVTSAAATRRFRSELTAMNAEQRPQFRETGGSVTNIGDVNVNISTQDASDIEGRSIARELKRELRTRTSSL